MELEMNDKIIEALEDAEKRHLAEQSNWRKTLETLERDSLVRSKHREDMIIKYLHRAHVSDYADWLAGHLARGGKITHVYDYDFHTQNFFVANSSCEIGNLYGTQSLDIIVPFDKTVSAGGHCNVYPLAYDKDTVAYQFVPLFNDVRNLLRRSIDINANSLGLGEDWTQQ